MEFWVKLCFARLDLNFDFPTTLHLRWTAQTKLGQTNNRLLYNSLLEGGAALHSGQMLTFSSVTLCAQANNIAKSTVACALSSHI